MEASPPPSSKPFAPAPEPQSQPVSSSVPSSVTEPAPPVTKAPASPTAEAAPTTNTQQAASPAPKVESVKIRNEEPKLNAYLRKMIEVGASDLHMTSGMPPLVRLNGEMQPLDGDTPLSNEALSEILLEVIPEQNAEQFQTLWDSDFAHAIEGLARFRANYFMDQTGIGAVFRQIPFEILTPEQLGLPEQVLDLCWLSKGLVLVTGPTGSGKSTTLASMIDYINRNRSDHIITIEDPVEFVHPNKKCLVNQREIGTHTKSFKSALKAALREDPDIVLVGEMRDLETISIAIETAETGHLVFGTLHTTTAPSTVDRIIDQFPADRQSQIRTMLAESLKGVIAQVLCKKKEKGRAAAYEILIANSAISNNIREGKTHQLKSIMQTGKKDGMCTMNDSLLELVASGKVDAKEAYIKSVDKQGLKAMFANKGIKLELASKDD
ncbi:MAG: PilT/PilU family type 4a pilus ATPase [Trueperaceae bacterium]|nr:PilT/PilU family type 4a pilus ATPase [Trueperaceae bacterium]